MGALRYAGRGARKLARKPVTGPTAMPKRPTITSGTEDFVLRDRVPSVVRKMMSTMDTPDYRRAYRMLRHHEAELGTLEGVVCHGFLMVLLAKKVSAFAFGAQAADAVLDRFAGHTGDLAALYRDRAFRSFIASAAMCYTRVGRYADARALLDTEIAAGHHHLLAVRAEIEWIHDPRQAARDLDELAKLGSAAKPGNELLLKHLAVNVLGDDPLAVPGQQIDGEFALVNAIAAAREGRWAEYRTLVNGYFTGQGLSAPVEDADRPFGFTELCSGDDRALTGSGDGPLVSVIMSAYNAAETLAGAARSILDQTYRDIELIVVDDCSTDGTADILAELAGADDRVRVLRNDTNLGAYGSRNRGLEHAAGAYLTFHDADDWAHPQRIATHVAAMLERPDAAASRSDWLRVDERGAIDFRRWHKRIAHPNPASFFMKREVLERLGFFDTVRFSADSEYWYRTQRVFGRDQVVIVGKCLGFGRQHTTSLTRSGSGSRDAEDYSWRATSARRTGPSISAGTRHTSAGSRRRSCADWAADTSARSTRTTWCTRIWFVMSWPTTTAAVTASTGDTRRTT